MISKSIRFQLIIIITTLLFSTCEIEKKCVLPKGCEMIPIKIPLINLNETNVYCKSLTSKYDQSMFDRSSDECELKKKTFIFNLELFADVNINILDRPFG